MIVVLSFSLTQLTIEDDSTEEDLSLESIDAEEVNLLINSV